jgi:hypothetical protein
MKTSMNTSGKPAVDTAFRLISLLRNPSRPEGDSPNGKGNYRPKGFFEWMEGKRYKVHYRVFLSKYRAYTPCPTCHSTRLKEEVNVRIAGKTLPKSDMIFRFNNSLGIAD